MHKHSKNKSYTRKATEQLTKLFKTHQKFPSNSYFSVTITQNQAAKRKGTKNIQNNKKQREQKKTSTKPLCHAQLITATINRNNSFKPTDPEAKTQQPQCLNSTFCGIQTDQKKRNKTFFFYSNQPNTKNQKNIERSHQIGVIKTFTSVQTFRESIPFTVSKQPNLDITFITDDSKVEEEK